jgi:hypothetical protein
MDYKIDVMKRQDRKVRIEQESKAAMRTTPFTFRNKPVLLPVVRVPIGLPLYRMNNGRTRLKQAEYVRHNDLDPDYFLVSEEDVAAQQAQHRILLELSKDERASIYDELKYRARQTDDLLSTDTGVIVNGNRRLAAMRHLLVNEAESFESFNFVDIAILPHEANLEDIEEIESELQEIPETKLEYDWISRRLKLRYRRDVLRMPIERLLRMYRFKNKEEMNRELQQLQLAEEYLERYLNKPGEYELVEQSEEIVKQLQAATENKTPELSDIARLIAFPLIKEARDLGARAYEFRNAFGTDAEEVINRLATLHGLELSEPSFDDVLPDEDADDPLSGFAAAQDRFAPLKPVLLDITKSQQMASDIVRISTGIREEKKEGGRKLVALKRAEAANKAVHEIDLNGADPTTFPSIVAQLDSCIVQADKVRQQIKNLSPKK